MERRDLSDRRDLDEIYHYMTHKKSKGHLRTLGLVRPRGKDVEMSLQTCKDPKLWYLVRKFALHHVSVPWTTVEILDSIDYKPKRTKCEGLQYIISCGSYRGGNLVGSTEKDSWEVDINYQPLILSDPLITHGTKDFEGRRIQFIFYSLPTKKGAIDKSLDDFEAVSVDGEWRIAYTAPGKARVLLPKKSVKPSKMVSFYQQDWVKEEEGFNGSEAQSLLFLAMRKREENLNTE